MKPFGKGATIGLMLSVVLAVPLVARASSDAIYPFVTGLDPDETFLWVSIHHLVQLSLVLLVMRQLNPDGFHDWGFNLINLRRSLVWIVSFAAVFGVLEVVRLSGGGPDLSYPLTAQNLVGTQIFQYGLSGLGEEPLFRGFVMTFLAAHWSRVYRPLGIQIPVTILPATLLFMLAHVSFDPSSFAVSGVDFDQQMKALQLGVLYGLAFHDTKSLVAPIAIHGLSNGLQLTLMYYFV